MTSTVSTMMNTLVSGVMIAVKSVIPARRTTVFLAMGAWAVTVADINKAISTGTMTDIDHAQMVTLTAMLMEPVGDVAMLPDAVDILFKRQL